MAKIAAILGGGVIGGGWTARFLLMGWDVCVFDPDPEAERKVGEVLANARRALPALADVAMPAEGGLSAARTVADAVADADWIQECIPERLPLKREILAEVQAHCRADAIIGSSTSGFKPSELQEGAARPAQIVVAHPFNPVYLLPLVELVASEKTPPESIEKAKAVLTAIGMKPLHVRKEIDAHIADRLMEAVWREALWLIKDGVATTEEIDDAIRLGFGLRWAQMGLFETYRIAGGEPGMAHFIAQFGPALAWPWSKLTDVPELTDELVRTIADQSDAQSGNHTIRELERIRDTNLVAMMRALKAQNHGAGAVLREHDLRMAPESAIDIAQPIRTIDRTVPLDWTDYNGHMNESRYGQIFSDAADALMAIIGADQDYVANGMSYFTVDIRIRFLDETHAGDPVTVTTQVLEGRGKKLRLFHQLRHDDRRVLATADQLLIHVNLKTRRSSEPAPEVSARLAEIAAGHAELPAPGYTKGHR